MSSSWPERSSRCAPTALSPCTPTATGSASCRCRSAWARARSGSSLRLQPRDDEAPGPPAHGPGGRPARACCHAQARTWRDDGAGARAARPRAAGDRAPRPPPRGRIGGALGDERQVDDGGNDRQRARTRLALNADDPLVADLGRGRDGVTYFGIEDDSLALPELQHAADSKSCRNCGGPYEYEASYLAHLGRYRCPRCGRVRPEPAVAAERVTLHGMAGTDVSLRTLQ